MEGGRIKRSISNEEEEEKINTFFALIGNMQEMRDQMAVNGSKGEKERERERDMKSRGTVSFELEDFMECAL